MVFIVCLRLSHLAQAGGMGFCVVRRAGATYHTPDDTSYPPIREAQRSLWQRGLGFVGPDTDTLTMAYRQNGGTGTHFNEAGLKAHGLLWAESVSQYLDKVLQSRIDSRMAMRAIHGKHALHAIPNGRPRDALLADHIEVVRTV